MSTELPAQLLRIGAWQVDAAAGELRRAGARLRIEPKTMDLLLALAARPGEVVSRDELMEAVWPGVIVGDDALTQAVIKLRKALGDEAKAPAYVETIPKRGYRLLAAVERIVDTEQQPAAGPRGSSRRRMAQALLPALLLVAGLLAWHMQRPSPLPHASTLEMSAVAGPTVAVLPFEPLSDDTAQRWLARGISEDVATDLGRVSAMQLVAADAADARPVARYLVSGTVQRAGDQLKLNARLVDTVSRVVLWSARIERPFAELPHVQEAIVLQLAQALSLRVDEAERRRLAARYTRDVLAYEHFLHAQGALLVRQQRENDGARRLYQQAIEIDPNFARAYAGLALTHAADFRNAWSADGAASLARAFELAETARDIDADIPEVYWVLAYVHVQRREHDAAIRHLQRATLLQPSYADAHALLGGVHTYAGRPAETLGHLRAALRLNRHGGYLYFMLLGRAYLFLGDFEQALINLREAATRNPTSVEVRVYLAATHAAVGDANSARWEAEEVRSLDAAFTSERWLASYPMTDAAQIARLKELLAASGL